jgi:ankyrin repeat protein
MMMFDYNTLPCNRKLFTSHVVGEEASPNKIGADQFPNVGKLFMKAKYNVVRDNTLHTTARNKKCLSISIEIINNEPCEALYTNLEGQTVLLVAAANNNLALVEWLLSKNKSSIYDCDNDGCNVLMTAIIYNNINIVEWLVNNTAITINSQNKGGMTPLLLASKNGNLYMLQYLLTPKCLGGAGANSTTVDFAGNTCILTAASENHMDIVKWLHERDPMCVFEKNYAGQDVLLVACRAPFSDLVCWSLQATNGWVTEIRDIEGNSPFLTIGCAHSTMTFAGLGLMQWFVSQQPECVLETDHDGGTILSKAVVCGDFGFVKYLLASSWKETLIGLRSKHGDNILAVAIRASRFNIVIWLLTNFHYEVNYDVDSFGNTGFLYAVHLNMKCVVEVMLETFGSGVQMSEKDSNGNNALFLAVINNDCKMVSCLMNFHVYDQLPYLNNHGESVLDIAVASKNLDLVELLENRMQHSCAHS